MYTDHRLRINEYTINKYCVSNNIFEKYVKLTVRPMLFSENKLV